jgi:hypothetical protein
MSSITGADRAFNSPRLISLLPARHCAVPDFDFQIHNGNTRVEFSLFFLFITRLLFNGAPLKHKICANVIPLGLLKIVVKS